MIRQILLPIAAVLLTAPVAVNAQDDAAAQSDICSDSRACRVVPTLRVEKPDGEVSLVEMGMTLPWVTEGNVLLVPGDAVLIALAEVDGVLIPRLVDVGEAVVDGEPGKGQILFVFSSIERGVVTLTVSSGFADPIEYAAMKVSLADGPNRTSTCALMPGLTTIEQWSEPVYQLALWGFRRAQGAGCSEIDLGVRDQLQRNR